MLNGPYMTDRIYALGTPRCNAGAPMTNNPNNSKLVDAAAEK